MVNNRLVYLISQNRLLFKEPSAPPGNVSLKNLSSTALEVNWTALPKPVRHGIIRGYHLFMWKKSEGSDTSFNITLSSTAVYKLFEDLSKWTVYCIQMTAFTSVGDGPRSDVQCVRTFEDGKYLQFNHC